MRSLPLVPVVLFALAGPGCGRTALEPNPPPGEAGAPDRLRDLPADQMEAPPDVPAEMPVDHPPDVAPDLPRDLPPDLALDLPPDRPPPPDGALCVPTPEICNGVDDDCNGLVDENQAPIPCPSGGYRLCVGGHYSDCPRRCQVCVPGSKRTCITSFCTFWGNQECAADGMSFGKCMEATPPPACAQVASKMQRSPELEQCCIMNGYCCVDEFDVNKNNDRTEMLGRCESIICE